MTTTTTEATTTPAKTIDAALVRAVLDRAIACKGSLGLCWACKAAFNTHRLTTFAKHPRRGWDGSATYVCEACGLAAVKATARRTMPSKMTAHDTPMRALLAALAAPEAPMRQWTVTESVFDEDNRLELAGWADGWAHRVLCTVPGTTYEDAVNVACARYGVATLPRELTVAEVTP